LKRVTGLSPGQLRDAGGFQYLLGVVEPMLSPKQEPGEDVSIPRVAS
jgi:hypothetical protein